jgi:tRNA threonylcarbamoyladenosine biosynthesis protein TsaE
MTNSTNSISSTNPAKPNLTKFNNQTFLTESVEETFELGKEFGQSLSGGETIEFIGDLGAGKTSFVRGLAEGLGSTDRVSSPTFTISNIYQCGGLSLVHFDFYRLAEPGLMQEELSEAISDPSSTVCVEWAETVRGVLPKDAIHIEINSPAENSREFRFTF